MPYCTIRPDDPEGGRHLFAIRLAEIADRAWRGYSKHGLDWRYAYYRKLFLNKRTAPLISRIVEHTNDVTGTCEDCAFCTVLPLDERVARLHLGGLLSQYDFDSGHLSVTRAKRFQTFHYIQSVFIAPSYEQSFEMKKALRAAIVTLLKKQYCGYQGREFLIYAESGLPRGQALAIKQGLNVSVSRSKEGHPFFTYDSHIDCTDFGQRIRAMWER